MNPNTEPINLLWTGGYDSTFRLLQVIMEYKHPVQPFYILDTGRGSTIKEIDTRHRIVKAITQRYPYADRLILPTKFYALSDIKKDDVTTGKFKELNKQLHLGSQYDWLSRFAEQFKINNLELSIERSDRDTHFKDTSIFVPVKEKVSGNVYEVIESLSDDDPRSIFKPFRFPILDFSKIELQAHSTKKGYDDILNLSWFCFTPVNGKPCGLCNPCRYVVLEGMAYRLPKKALFRYRYFKNYEMFFKLRKTIKRQIRKVFPSYE
ncbi:hypothetical protein [Anditalea andensis]|uniref:7-cyano-7-deazaguanine synthase n=1 Tax=Anditalea andensis TaxID=1048983 RepID=A0A074KYC2_9BACT|nr:hypothetical protein [Anditalea andensis]KEO73195.1 hypothetical protein EL17_12630 [Anditalea andensis]